MITFILNFKVFNLRRKQGMYLPVILLASVIFIAMATAIISIALSNVKIANLHNKKITSMSIAEAGINYYMWHLAHNNTDYCDGAATCSGSGTHGPYHHDYTDESGKSIGTYDLFITPPTTSYSSVVVKSVGKVNGISPTKTIVSEVGMPSFTKYTLLVDSNPLTLGSGGKINGTVFVNHAKFDNEGEVTGDASSTEVDGVYGSGVFGGAKLFPVPAIDFTKLDVDIKKIRDDAKIKNDGYYDSSGSNGYYIVLKDNNYDLYRVTNFDNQDYNIKTKTFLGNHTYPTEGVIICEDNVWVDGMVNDDRVTIIAADPEENNNNKKKKIFVTGEIKYTNKDGRDKVGLISQTSIWLARNVPNTMELDAAMIARNGTIQIDNYGEKKTLLNIFGSIAAKTSYWKYLSGNTFTSGFANRNITIDQFNVLNPPPKFPLTGTYAILSWREE